MPKATFDSAREILTSTEVDSSRVSRLLRIVQSIREDPHQPLTKLWARLGIGKSQFL